MLRRLDRHSVRVLRNFRSKYVGETEGNLEQVLTVLRSLGPVLVIIDEADAALGNRQASGDSGTSARVFSMIASQMGNTRYRGQIIWMLLTSRPDLLPIDLKRQGRAEVHIPLFYPHEEESIRAMFLAMAKKNKTILADDAIPPVDLTEETERGRHREYLAFCKKAKRSRRAKRGVTGRPRAIACRVHSVGARTGEGIARPGGGAGMYADELFAAGVAREGAGTEWAVAAAGAVGGDSTTNRGAKCIVRSAIASRRTEHKVTKDRTNAVRLAIRQ